MAKVINAYTVEPDDIKVGDTALFVVKIRVEYADRDGSLRYRVYRAPWYGSSDDIPQGVQVSGEEAICEQLFPTLAALGYTG